MTTINLAEKLFPAFGKETTQMANPEKNTQMDVIQQYVSSVIINCGKTTAQRKNSELVIRSASKKRKVSPRFQRNLDLWKHFEQHMQAVPTESAWLSCVCLAPILLINIICEVHWEQKCR